AARTTAGTLACCRSSSYTRRPARSPRRPRTQRGRNGTRRCTSCALTPAGLLQLAEHPLRRVGRQLGQVLQELLHVVARDARPEVVAQELVEVGGDARGEAPAAAERRDDEARHLPEPPPVRQRGRDLVELAVGGTSSR